MDFFMNKEKSDVVFVVEGKRIPALKAFLSVKSRVFCAMFLGEFKESKDKEVVIEDTTYEAFKAFLQFLYCDDLGLKDYNDFELIGELYRLSDRYDVSRLEHRITNKLIKSNSNLFKSVSEEDFQTYWLKINSISKIAFEFKIIKLMDNVMTYITRHFDHLLKKDIKELNELNDTTGGRLLDLMAEMCKDFNGLKESLKQIKSYVCANCGVTNQVQSIDTFTKCRDCKKFFSDFI